LLLHDLSDALPANLHMTLPSTFGRRRLVVPDGLILHVGTWAAADCRWFDCVPITTFARTLNDCAEDQLAPDLLRQAAQQALRRGLVQADQIPGVTRALAPFGGLVA
jgi:predicted transcriptional regulator of viral defense system